MKITVWEKNIINGVLGISNHVHISELEQMLDLRKKLKLTDKETKLLRKDLDKSMKTDSGVTLTRQEAELVNQKLSNDRVNVPGRQETIDMLRKLQSINEEKNTDE